jgi:hypothetical protein
VLLAVAFDGRFFMQDWESRLTVGNGVRGNITVAGIFGGPSSTLNRDIGILPSETWEKDDEINPETGSRTFSVRFRSRGVSVKFCDGVRNDIGGKFALPTIEIGVLDRRHVPR